MVRNTRQDNRQFPIKQPERKPQKARSATRLGRFERGFKEKVSVCLKGPIDLHNECFLGVGGQGLYKFIPTDSEELWAAVRFCIDFDMPYVVIGGGANICFGDKYNGLIIRTNRLRGITQISDKLLQVEPGTRLDQMSLSYTTSVRTRKSTDNDMVGYAITHRLYDLAMPFVDVPGTIGGAVVGNTACGVYMATADLVKGVRVTDKNGTTYFVDASKLGFEYRKSNFSNPNHVLHGAVVLHVMIECKSSVYDMDDIMESARCRQPRIPRYNNPKSAGSWFAKCDPLYIAKQCSPTSDPITADKCIEIVLRRHPNLRNEGGISLYPDNCGIFTNPHGTATPYDVLKLEERLMHAVDNHLGITLRREVQYISTKK